ncbi:MAG: hypothetical protein EA397_13395 [Deltaproteobacteria bacterium]|nr:MAG: hypothetical protein EA397_13395 [Deltaproteobacteria bacterium]
MRSVVFVASLSLVFALSGCKKGAPEKVADSDASTSDADAPAFVDLSLMDDDEDLDDLMGSELNVPVEEECGQLRRLEPKAMMGKLTDGEIRCLDRTLRESDRQTYKNKVSRVLMADAFAKKNDDRWEAVVRRHLNDIDRSDPDLCYKFAAFMAKRVTNKGPDAADEVMKWADVALENKQVWSGDAYVKRVHNLYKIKAVAAYQKWEWLEAKFKKDPTAEVSKAREESRNEAKNLAREWLAYAKDAGLDQADAYNRCVSAAGTSEFCQI